MELKYCPQCGKRLCVKKENGSNRLFCKNCNKFLYENPVPVVAGIVLDKNKRILLIKRGIEPNIGSWALPSGFMEIDESPDESIIREMKEETNLVCRIRKLLGTFKQKGFRYKNIIVLAYLLDVVKGIPEAGDDATALRFFDVQNLPEIPFTSHRKIIRTLFSKKG